jgi:aminopeptidase N
MSEGQSITEWQVDSPIEPAWFGFALGGFSENVSDAEGVKLRLLAGTQLAAGKQIFDATAAAMRYLGERTGKHYPGQTYTQVFVHGDTIRPMAAGLTLLPESYAQGLEKQSDDVWLMADELAHQWYGLGITAKDGSNSWLSKGLSAFVADAFLGQQFGKEKYEREIGHAKQIYNQLRAEGKDRALSDSAGEAEVAEYKGAWFLYLVDQLIGDNAFWNGLQLYTRDQWGQAAASEDLQKAFDGVDTGHPETEKKDNASGRKKNAKASQKPLDNLFDLWVYGLPDTNSKTKSR